MREKRSLKASIRKKRSWMNSIISPFARMVGQTRHVNPVANKILIRLTVNFFSLGLPFYVYVISGRSETERKKSDNNNNNKKGENCVGRRRHITKVEHRREIRWQNWWKKRKQSSSVVVLKILLPFPVKLIETWRALIFPQDCSYDWISVPFPDHLVLLVGRVRQAKLDPCPNLTFSYQYYL